MAGTPEGFRIEKTFGARLRRSTDSPAEILRSLTDGHGFDPRADVATSLPHQAFFFADVQTDAAGRAQLQAGDTSSLTNWFPLPAEDALPRICTVLPSRDAASSLLVAATSCEQVREHLATLETARLRPARVDAPMIAVQTAITANHPDAARGLALVVYVDDATLSIAVTGDGKILLVRSLPMLSDETQGTESLARQTAEIVAQEGRITWNRLFGKDPEPGLRIFLIASNRTAELLVPAIAQKIDSRVQAVNPCARVAASEPLDPDFSLCVAEGLALRVLQPKGADDTDFLDAYRTRTQPRVQPRRELAVCGGLAAGVVAMWVVGLFLQLSSLESRYAHLKRQEEAIFRRLAPDEQTIVDPAAQLQQRLDALRKDCELFTCFNPGRPGPLEVLAALSRRMPTRGRVKLDDVLIADESVRIRGTCDSFATFSEWQRLLEETPGLRLDGDPQLTKDADSERVQFMVPLSTTERKAS